MKRNQCGKYNKIKPHICPKYEDIKSSDNKLNVYNAGDPLSSNKTLPITDSCNVCSLTKLDHHLPLTEELTDPRVVQDIRRLETYGYIEACRRNDVDIITKHFVILKQC